MGFRATGHPTHADMKTGALSAILNSSRPQLHHPELAGLTAVSQGTRNSVAHRTPCPASCLAH